MKKLLFAVMSLATLFVSCSGKKGQVARSEDYSAYMKEGLLDKAVTRTSDEIKFWNQRLQRDTGNFVDMLELASQHFQLFKLTGDIASLGHGDSLLKRSTNKLNDKDAGILHALAQASITQHRFHDAANYNELALAAKGDPYTIALLNFDAEMELGFYREAIQQLERVRDKNSFDYLVRKAKWEDHLGNQGGAIELMERAMEKVKGKNASRYNWVLSNLGDMYSHAGRVEDAYRSYLDVLKLDSSSLYALKGIAWIAYSHDHNTREAKRIFKYILSQTHMPELYLTLAEIEEYEGHHQAKLDYTRQFVAIVNQPAYGNMYNKYLIQVFADELTAPEKSLVLAQKELNNRVTPETNAWLAWSYYSAGDRTTAFNIARTQVYKQDHEPSTLFHTAIIYAANGKKNEAREMLNSCQAATFELGPVKSGIIKKQLASL